MSPIVLFREDFDSEGERDVVARHLPVTRFRSLVPSGSMVVGRYSVLPLYQELEDELAMRGSRLVNTWAEHSFIADVTAWAGLVLGDLTPRTWTTWSNLPEGLAYVVKGRTNSRKHQWATHMFASSRAEVPEVARRLLDDTMIREQGLVVREYVPLVQLGTGLNGLPVTNEWRTFWYGTTLLAKGFYWGSHPEVSASARWTAAAEALARTAAKRIAPHATFFVLDVAETASGEWIVIEVNDGQMSGPAMVDADELYGALARVLVPAPEVEESMSS